MSVEPTIAGPAPFARAFVRARLASLRAAADRIRGRAEFYLLPRTRSFLGAYASYEEAMANVPAWALKGYDHDDVVDVSFDAMCRVAVWDYPVLFWLRSLEGEVSTVLDAGGHMGTKFRAFDGHVRLRGRVRWTVYDTPSVVQAGRRRAAADGLGDSLFFTDDLAAAEPADLVLASGLFQYYPGDPVALFQSLSARPRYAILNKVAVREGRSVVTLERIGNAFVPYQIRNRTGFEAAFDLIGYDVIDTWDIPALGHVVRSHPELGTSVSRGYVLRRRDGPLHE